MEAQRGSSSPRQSSGHSGTLTKHNSLDDDTACHSLANHIHYAVLFGLAYALHCLCSVAVSNWGMRNEGMHAHENTEFGDLRIPGEGSVVSECERAMLLTVRERAKARW